MNEFSPPAGTEAVLPFQVRKLDLRGRLVRLGPSIDVMLRGHDYPPPVASLLAETLTLAAILASSIKYDGIFTLQIRGDGPVRLIVTDVTSHGQLRGYAQYDAAALEQVVAAAPKLDNPVQRLLGAGSLAFTVDQGGNTDRYQGVVPLEGGTVADCAHAYFRQSEQLLTGIKIAVAAPDERHAKWRAGGLMVQRLPGSLTPDGFAEADAEEIEDAWRRAVILLSTASDRELTDASLPMSELVWRLYHEDSPEAFPARHLEFGCRCSRERIVNVLRSFPRAEIEAMKEDDEAVVVKCEFCAAEYRFDDDDLEAVWRQDA
ncbi:MAG: Hsp33 family molecular chaperone HslO [Reyranellaceae bacterium]